MTAARTAYDKLTKNQKALLSSQITDLQSKLEAAVSPSNAANKQVTWKSSNKKLASVNSKGIVKISKKAAGKTVKITATAKDGSGKKAIWKIKVMKGAVKKITLKGKKKVKAGKALIIKSKVETTKGKAHKKLQWTSSNKNYATVNSNGDPLGTLPWYSTKSFKTPFREYFEVNHDVYSSSSEP